MLEQYNEPARFDHSRKFPKCHFRVRDRTENQRRERRIESIIRERKLLGVSLCENDGGRLGPGMFEHPKREFAGDRGLKRRIMFEIGSGAGPDLQ